MYEEHLARKTPEELSEHEAMIRAGVLLGGKLGDANEDLVPVVVFLASTGARFITGQVIAVNGGLGMVR
jgi:NAD(P)-dependent dehydrogenase (short-subunit alcohol dehydrogenase family)